MALKCPERHDQQTKTPGLAEQEMSMSQGDETLTYSMSCSLPLIKEVEIPFTTFLSSILKLAGFLSDTSSIIYGGKFL